ncbi:MAG TPA: DMT family transporter [Azospirillum sp.]
MEDAQFVAGTPGPAFRERREVRGAAWGLAAAMLTAGWWVITRHGVTTAFDQYDVAALRFATSGLLLAPVLWRNRRAIAAVPPLRLAVMVLCAGAPYSLITGTGLQFASAGNGGTLVNGVMPLFAALLSAVLLRESVGPSRCLGLGIVVAGVLGLSGGAGLSVTSSPLFLLAGLMWAGFTVALRGSGLGPLAAVAFVCVVSGAVYLPAYLLLSDDPVALTAPLAESIPQAAYQGLLSAIVAVYCFAKAVMLLGAARAAVFGALVPVLASLLGAALLAEVPTSAEALSVATVALGAGLASGAVRLSVPLRAAS